MKKILILIRQPGLLEFLLPFIKANNTKKKNDIIILTTTKIVKTLFQNKIRAYKVYNLNLDLKNKIHFLIYNWKPHVIFMGAFYVKRFKEFYDCSLVAAAMKNNIKLIQCIEASYDYYIRIKETNQGRVFPNKLLLINRKSKKEAAKEGIHKNIIEAVGHPGWENIRFNKNQNYKNILFINQPLESDFGSSLGFTEDDVWCMVYSIFKKNKNDFDNLFWAPHPRDKSLISLKEFKKVKIVKNVNKALEVSGIVVGIYSNLLVNAFLLGKKVISIIPGDKRNEQLSPLIKWNLITKVNNYEQLKVEIYKKNNKEESLQFLKNFKNSLKRLEQVLK